MANPLKKTMVYLGLADEELEQEEELRPQAQHQTPAPTPVAPISHAPASSHAVPSNTTPSHGRAPVTPLRSKSHSAPKATVQEMNEILTVHPRQYRDAQVVAEAFRDGIPVIINLSQMSEGDARRLIDFASGLSQGLYGKIERVTSKVFLLSPSHVVVSGDHGAGKESDVEASFFAAN